LLRVFYHNFCLYCHCDSFVAAIVIFPDGSPLGFAGLSMGCVVVLAWHPHCHTVA